MLIRETVQGQKKVQSEIKAFLSQLETIEGWKELPPYVSNTIRHVIIRAAWACYKIGLLSG